MNISPVHVDIFDFCIDCFKKNVVLKENHEHHSLCSAVRSTSDSVMFAVEGNGLVGS